MIRMGQSLLKLRIFPLVRLTQALLCTDNEDLSPHHTANEILWSTTDKDDDVIISLFWKLNRKITPTPNTRLKWIHYRCSWVCFTFKLVFKKDNLQKDNIMQNCLMVWRQLAEVDIDCLVQNYTLVHFLQVTYKLTWNLVSSVQHTIDLSIELTITA